MHAVWRQREAEGLGQVLLSWDELEGQCWVTSSPS